MDSTEFSGDISFRFRNDMADEYIKAEWKTKWDEWRHKWCYVTPGVPHPSFRISTEAATRGKSWMEKDKRDKEFAPTVERIKRLRRWGLTAQMVVVDFL